MTRSPRPSPWPELSPSARRVALEVLLHGPLARTELARRLDLSSPSLTRLTKPLLDLGILLEAPEPPSSGGRPIQPLDIDPAIQHFIGVKLTGETAHGVLTDLRAQILAHEDLAVTSHDPDDVVAVLAALIDRLGASSPTPTAVGVALGGSVRDMTHVVRAPFLAWGAVDLAHRLRRATGLPAVISNDLDALMEAEHWFGDGNDVQSFATLTIGVGVGGGLVVHDRLVTGVDSGLGLLGHFPLDPLGPACAEGHRGCSNSLLSMNSIRTQAALALGRPVTYDQVLDLAALGDPIADHIVGNAAHGFGVLIAAVANIAQPERILLTGEGIRLAHVASDRLRAGITASRIPEASPIDLRVIDDDPTVWARGAAAVAIQRTLLAEPPVALGRP